MYTFLSNILCDLKSECYWICIQMNLYTNPVQPNTTCKLNLRFLLEMKNECRYLECIFHVEVELRVFLGIINLDWNYQKDLSHMGWKHARSPTKKKLTAFSPKFILKIVVLIRIEWTCLIPNELKKNWWDAGVGRR